MVFFITMVVGYTEALQSVQNTGMVVYLDQANKIVVGDNIASSVVFGCCRKGGCSCKLEPIFDFIDVYLQVLDGTTFSPYGHGCNVMDDQQKLAEEEASVL